MNRDQRGNINIASDNKPDLRFICWVKVDTIELSAGRHKIAFRMNSGPQNHGGIDCFVFTRIPFVPSGANKPTIQSAAATPDAWFPVVMDDDKFLPDSIIDMSHLVEAPAGKHGFLKRDRDTLRFEDASTPTKFWAINGGPSPDWSARADDAGRPLVPQAWLESDSTTYGDQCGRFNELRGRVQSTRLDHYDRWFATLKEQGIYTTWSVIYPHHGRFLQKHDDIDPALFEELDRADEQADGNRAPISVNDYINLDPSLQAIAWKYFQSLLNHVNPYTGLAYKDDPALAMLEFQNESNVFFFTLNTLSDASKMPILSRRMRRGFFLFVKAKYGTKGEDRCDVGGRWMDGDDWETGELRLMGAHHWGSEGPKYEYSGQTRRAGDYIEFLTKIQRDYYSRRQRQVREAGFKGATVTTAWKSGGPAASMANLYADTAADVIDRHNYFGGGDGGHRIVEGKVDNASHLSDPGRGLLSVGLFQVANFPFAYSELSQMPPESLES